MRLDPATIPTGIHHILMYKNNCSEFATVTLVVGDPVDFSVQQPTDLYLCDSIYDLKQFIIGDTQGVWLLGDSILIVDNLIDVKNTDLDTGTYRLIYANGIGSCLKLDTVSLTVRDAPDADLKDLNIVLTENAGAFDLDTFFTMETTRGGVWSGGTYVTPDGQFDPSNLPPGEYQVTYTVGTGDCLRTSSVTIRIDELTSTAEPSYLTDVMFRPNPASNVVYIRGVRGEISVTLYGSSGEKVLETVVSEAENEIDISQLPEGVYLARLSDDDRSMWKKLVRQ